jgi:hypothetical protein
MLILHYTDTDYSPRVSVGYCPKAMLSTYLLT